MMRKIDHITPEIEARQRAELGDTNEYIVRTRAEDRSTLVRIGYLWDKYRPIIWLVGGVLLALGFDFKTPAQSYKELETRIAEVKAENTRLADQAGRLERRADAERDTIKHKLDILIAVRCLDPKTARELAVAQIDCNRYLFQLRNGR